MVWSQKDTIMVGLASPILYTHREVNEKMCLNLVWLRIQPRVVVEHAELLEVTEIVRCIELGTS